MNKHLESIYERSPIFLQNAFCSLYGLKLYKERYSSPWKKYYAQLLNSQHASIDEIRFNQTSALKAIVKQAIEHVPFYRENVKLSLSEVQGISLTNLHEIFPIIEKNHLRKKQEMFLSRKFDKKELIRINTSGTTGTPLAIYFTHNARKMNYAFFARFKNWAGIKGFEKSITLAGRIIVPYRQDSPPYWRSNKFFNNILMSSYHLSPNTLSAYVQKIKDFKPVFIDSYPSSLAAIADFIIKNKISDVKVKTAITSSETLLAHQRELIERAFACKVYDQYGSAEQVVFACQCEQGSYHINPEYGLLEVLDQKGRAVPEGEIGQLVCTGFTNEAMPLIRYKIEDIGSVSAQPCACGRNFQVLKNIYGRKDDILITPEGRYVGRLDPIFKGLSSSIRETQIIQEKSDLVNVLIVKADNFEERHAGFIVEELKKRMGTVVTYTVTYVDSIPRTNSGKFRAVICKVDSKK